MNRSVVALLTLAAMSCCARTEAQTSDSQVFQVRVLGALSIAAPSNLAEIGHDDSKNDQEFPTQTWTAASRSPLGAVVTFQTDQAFTNTGDPTAKRNAELVLQISQSPKWTVTQKVARTDYEGGQEVATVQAESNRASAATFELDVTFLEENGKPVPDGVYEMIVTGTIIPK